MAPPGRQQNGSKEGGCGAGVGFRTNLNPTLLTNSVFANFSDTDWCKVQPGSRGKEERAVLGAVRRGQPDLPHLVSSHLLTLLTVPCRRWLT